MGRNNFAKAMPTADNGGIKALLPGIEIQGHVATNYTRCLALEAFIMPAFHYTFIKAHENKFNFVNTHR